MTKKGGFSESVFLEKIAPGGKYFKYSLSALILLGFVLIAFLVMIALPILTGGRFSNPVSRKVFGEPEPTPIAEFQPAPTLCPNYKISTGKRTFKMSHGPLVAGPKIQSVTYDPLDPQSGQKQTITITVKNDSPVTFAGVTLLSDNSDQQNAKFKLVNGSDMDGTWELTWQVKDSYNCRYGFRFDLQSSTGNYNTPMFIR